MAITRSIASGGSTRAAGCIYRVDGWRGQTTSDVWIERKIDLIRKYKPLAWFGEGGVIQKRSSRCFAAE
jgi:hypothetical protein